MRIRLLGTAAGGGVPQWNCNCPVCRLARDGSGRVLPRTQSSVAVTVDGQGWFLLNASPDLRAQLEACKDLHPPSGQSRGTPIEAVLVTNADLDHTLGLTLMREGAPLVVHATPEVRHSLTRWVGPVLDAFCGVQWMDPPVARAPLLRHNGTDSGLLYRAIHLSGKGPRFDNRQGQGHVIGYELTDARTGGRLLFLPGVASLEADLLPQLSQCDALLFDGTFWTEDEMVARGAGRASAGQMGHLPVSGPDGSLKVLAPLPVRHKVYVHMNNTNPMLIEDSAERHAVEAAGCIVGFDGMELSL